MAAFVARASAFSGAVAEAMPDTTGRPFSRAVLRLRSTSAAGRAAALSQKLRAGRPAIWAMDHSLAQGKLQFELVALSDEETEMIVARLDSLSHHGSEAGGSA